MRAFACLRFCLAAGSAWAASIGSAETPADAPAGARFRPLVATRFPGPGLPQNWSQAGESWTIRDGALSPPAGDFGTILSYRPGGAGQSTLDQKEIAIRVTLVSPESRFALCTQGTYGTIAEIDGVDHVLRFYRSWAGGAPSPVLGTVPIPFPLRAGGDYGVSLVRTLGAHDGGVEHLTVLTLTDEATGRRVRYPAFFTGGVLPWPGHMWGAPGVMFRSGRIRLREFRYGSPYPAAPRLWIGGDSFVEGDSIATAKDRRFAQQLSVALKGDAVISGGGGATSGDLLARLPVDLAPFSPRYCLILIGANDHDFAPWLDHERQIIAFVRAKGSIPVLGTLAPQARRQAFLNQANAWIRRSGEAVVDFASALTLHGDGITWNPELAKGDGVHPNVAGHFAMMARLRQDAPFLFSE